MSARSKIVHSEHVLREYDVGPNNAPDVRLFRTPNPAAASTGARQFPHEVAWEDLKAGDVVVAIELHSINPAILPVLEVWHVKETSFPGTARVLANKLVGSGMGHEDAIDRLKGLVGL